MDKVRIGRRLRPHHSLDRGGSLSLTGEDANTTAFRCFDVLKSLTSPTSTSKPASCPSPGRPASSSPILPSNPTLDVRQPLSHALGLPVSAQATLLLQAPVASSWPKAATATGYSGSCPRCRGSSCSWLAPVLCFASWAHLVWPCSIFGSPWAECSDLVLSCSLLFVSMPLCFSLTSRLHSVRPFPFSKERALSIPIRLSASY